MWAKPKKTVKYLTFKGNNNKIQVCYLNFFVNTYIPLVKRKREIKTDEGKMVKNLKIVKFRLKGVKNIIKIPKNKILNKY